jgi:hypothetical protein
MSKSRKKKSGKQQVSGQTLGALALIISIGALGLGVYQLISPQASGPQFYILEYDDILFIDQYSAIDYHNELNITYNTKVGDSVVLELSCRLRLIPVGTTTLAVYFDNNGTTPLSTIYLQSDVGIVTTGYMKYVFDATTAGENRLVIYTYIDDETTNSYITDCLLTVTVYG